MQTSEIRRLTEFEDRHWWYRERRAVLARELRRLPAPAAGERALDIGAAGGGNTRVLAARGWRALATDSSEAAVAIARDRGIEALHADARDLPFEPASFGLVTAFDVLEHIEEDGLAAAELTRVLRPAGTALVAVPCDMTLWSEHDIAVGHVRRYDREGLAALLWRAGLVVDRVWSWNVLLRPLVALRRRGSTGSDLEETAPAVNAALRAVVAAERFLPLGSLPGVSLMVRAHRPRREPPARSHAKRRPARDRGAIVEPHHVRRRRA